MFSADSKTYPRPRPHLCRGHIRLRWQAHLGAIQSFKIRSSYAKNETIMQGASSHDRLHLGGHYTFLGGGQSIDLDAIIQGLALE
jgi:hypothetical protein